MSALEQLEQAAKMALEALEQERPYLGAEPSLTSKAIELLRPALQEANLQAIADFGQVQESLAVVDAAQQADEPVAVVGDVYDLCWIGSGPIAPIIKKHGIKVGDKLYTRPQPAAPIGLDDFLADLQRSRDKYPKNGRMFDGLMGEVDELRRAYAGDGDMRSEAFDVAVCAFRIAVEGDAGGNTRLDEQATPAAPWVGLTGNDVMDCLGEALNNKQYDGTNIGLAWLLYVGLNAKLCEKNGGEV